MKPETMMYEIITQIIPNNSDKTLFFASITKASYEVFFYSFINGVPKQCYTLADEGKLDENKLDNAFESVVKIIRNSKVFKEEKINVATIVFDKTEIKMNVEYYDKGSRKQKILKEWLLSNGVLTLKD